MSIHLWQLFQKQPSAAEYKKTDAPQPDVKEEEKVEEKDKEAEEEDEEEEEEEISEEKPGMENWCYPLVEKISIT